MMPFLTAPCSFLLANGRKLLLCGLAPVAAVVCFSASPVQADSWQVGTEYLQDDYANEEAYANGSAYVEAKADRQLNGVYSYTGWSYAEAHVRGSNSNATYWKVAANAGGTRVQLRYWDGNDEPTTAIRVTDYFNWSASGSSASVRFGTWTPPFSSAALWPNDTGSSYTSDYVAETGGITLQGSFSASAGFQGTPTPPNDREFHARVLRDWTVGNAD